jgi:hypothetical protein
MGTTFNVGGTPPMGYAQRRKPSMIVSHERKKTLIPNQSPEIARNTFHPMSSTNPEPYTKSIGNLSDQGEDVKVSKWPSRSVVRPSSEKLAKVAQHGLFVVA